MSSLSEDNLRHHIKIFLTDLTDDQIDLIDKLSNMYCNSISEEVYDIVSENEELMKKVNDRIRALAIFYVDDILYETINLQKMRDTEDFDLIGGLYNTDQLYVKAIEDILQ